MSFQMKFRKKLVKLYMKKIKIIRVQIKAKKVEKMIENE